MTHNPLRDAAKYLESKGRYGDTMLVHLNPKEVRFLESMSPTGSLTVNPHTGLQEAFLPALLAPILGSLAGGAAASAFPALGISTALGAGLGSGLASFAATGDLAKGVTSGLLGYGLGSATDLLAAGTEGIAGAGGEAAKEAAKNAAATAAMPTETASHLMTGTADYVPSQISQMGQAGTGAGLNVPTTNYVGNDDIARLIEKNMPAPHIAAQQDAAALSPFDKWGAAAENVTNPDVLKNTFWTNASRTTMPIAGGLIGEAMMSEQGQSAPPPYQYQTNYSYPGNRGTGRRYLSPNPDPQGREQTYFGYADGGEIDPGRSKYEQDDKYDFVPRKREGAGLKERGRVMTLKQAEEWARETDKMRDGRGYGGVTSPNPFYRGTPPVIQYAKGGYIGGPGGGLDDAIPAIIDGRQPAKLSSGEYVVPAHAVSALGNGSTEHGVRELDKMVDRTMQSKFGTKNRKPRPIKAENMMAGLGSMRGKKGAGKKAKGPFEYQSGGIIDRLFGTGAKSEGPPPDPGRSWDMDPPTVAWPTKEDVEAAREYKRMYGNPNEYMIDGPRMVNRQYERPGRQFLMATPKDAARWYNDDDTSGVKIQSANQEQADEQYAGQLAAQTDPFGYLGYDPTRIIVNNPRRGREWGLGGAYDPKSDVMMYGGQSQSTIAHESMHRGLAALRKENSKIQKDTPFREEELVRRMMMDRFGPIERMSLEKDNIPREKWDFYIEKAESKSPRRDEYIREIRKLGHHLVAKKNIEREGGVK